MYMYIMDAYVHLLQYICFICVLYDYIFLGAQFFKIHTQKSVSQQLNCIYMSLLVYSVCVCVHIFRYILIGIQVAHVHSASAVLIHIVVFVNLVTSCFHF